MQSLQYKVLHLIIPCNSYLKQLRVKDTIDTIAHFLFLCPIVQAFWITICRWFKDSVDIRLYGISAKDFFFGVDPSFNRGKIINYVLLQTKYFVHRQNLFHQGFLRLLHFLQELRVKLRCEKSISCQEGKSVKSKKMGTDSFGPWLILLLFFHFLGPTG